MRKITGSYYRQIQERKGKKLESWHHGDYKKACLSFCSVWHFYSTLENVHKVNEDIIDMNTTKRIRKLVSLSVLNENSGGTFVESDSSEQMTVSFTFIRLLYVLDLVLTQQLKSRFIYFFFSVAIITFERFQIPLRLFKQVSHRDSGAFS